MSLLFHPLWLVILPLAMAPVIYVLRRRERLAGFLAALTTLVTARLCLSMPFDWSIVLRGRTMSLQPPDRMYLAFAFSLISIYFVYAVFISQGWSFFYLGPVIMGLFSAAIMIDNMVVTVVLLEIVATLTVLIVQAGRRLSVRGSLYFLVSFVIAMPPLLIAAHLTEMRVLNPIDTTLPRVTAFLLVLGVSLLLGAVPFQAWLYAVSMEAAPIIVAFILSITHGVIFFELFGLLHRFPWLVSDGNVLLLALAVGLGSVIVGGVLAAFQRNFGKLLAWAALFDAGFLLVALSSTSDERLAILALLVLNRGIAISLVGMGMGVLRQERGNDLFQAMTGIVWRKPFAVLALGVGGLSLAGFPLTAGFTARWLAVQGLPVEVQKWAIVLVVAGAAVSIGYLRGISAMVGAPASQSNEQEPLIVRILISLLLMVNMVLALYPQIVVHPIAQVMATWNVPR
jgi:formate hydrogenlyase subunit 3/multisubunit Na+/H+ antiporter MnhD subunit